MLVSEAEAAKKWCPMSRGDGGRNKIAGGPVKDSYCLVLGCMVWRSVEVGEHKGKGYCGLAGNP